MGPMGTTGPRARTLEILTFPKDSTFRRWYAQVLISQSHGNNRKPKTSPGDGLRLEIRKVHQ